MTKDTKRRRVSKAKRSFTFRCSDAMYEVLNELSISGGTVRAKDFASLTKTDWLILGLVEIVRLILHLNICREQVDSVDDVENLFRLFVMWSRAEQ